MKLKDWSDRLIWATILISIVRYAAAFAASDVGEITGVWSSILTGLLSFTGIGMGMLDTIGGGLLFNGWSRVLPKQGASGSTRFHILSVCVATLLISGLYILVPFTMSRLSHESILLALGGKGSFWAWSWSLMVNLIPYVLIAGVFVGNKMVTALEIEESSGTTSGSSFGSSGSSIKTSGSTSGTGRPSIHQDRVFSYLEKSYIKTGVVPTYTDVVRDLNLPQSTASRIRNDWIETKRKN